MPAGTAPGRSGLTTGARLHLAALLCAGCLLASAPTSALRTVAGVRVTPCRSGGTVELGCDHILVGRGPRGRTARIYLNGLPMYGGSSEFLLDLDPKAVTGVEVCTSALTATVRYRGLQSDGGVVLVWTR